MADLITGDQVRRAQRDGDIVVVDVRSPEEYAEGHLPGAANIPIDDLDARLGELPAGRPVVTYCAMRHPGNSRGERAAARLRELGRDARALDGGFTGWTASHMPIERGA